MPNDYNFLKSDFLRNGNLVGLSFFFLCNFYNLKNLYKEHIIHPLLGEFSLFEILILHAAHLYTQFCQKRNFPFAPLRSKPGRSLQEASDTEFPHDARYPECQFDGNLCPVCSPNQCTCFKIHVRIKLLPIFCKSGFQAQHKH